MLRDDIARYTELSGNDGLHTPIGIIGAYLDGYEKGKADAPPERKFGEWIPVTNGRGGHECSMCHMYAPSFKNGEENLSPYCPNCGVKMK